MGWFDRVKEAVAPEDPNIPGTTVPRVDNGKQFPTATQVKDKVQEISTKNAEEYKSKQEKAKIEHLKNIGEIDAAILESFFHNKIEQHWTPDHHYVTTVYVGKEHYVGIHSGNFTDLCNKYKLSGGWERVEIKVDLVFDKDTRREKGSNKITVKMYRSKTEEEKRLLLFPTTTEIASSFDQRLAEFSKYQETQEAFEFRVEHAYQELRKKIVEKIRESAVQTYQTVFLPTDFGYIMEFEAEIDGEFTRDRIARMENEFAAEGGWESVEVNVKKDSSFNHRYAKISIRFMSKDKASNPKFRDVGFQVHYLYNGRPFEKMYIMHLDVDIDPTLFFSQVLFELRKNFDEKFDKLETICIHVDTDDGFYTDVPKRDWERLHPIPAYEKA